MVSGLIVDAVLAVTATAVCWFASTSFVLSAVVFLQYLVLTWFFWRITAATVGMHLTRRVFARPVTAAEEQQLSVAVTERGFAEAAATTTFTQAPALPARPEPLVQVGSNDAVHHEARHGVEVADAVARTGIDETVTRQRVAEDARFEGDETVLRAPTWVAEVILPNGTPQRLTHRLVFGRRPERISSEASEQLVTLPDEGRSVSRTHLLLAPSATAEGGALAVDLGSANGTRVVRDGHEQLLTAHVEFALCRGDEVRLGRFTLRIA